MFSLLKKKIYNKTLVINSFAVVNFKNENKTS